MKKLALISAFGIFASSSMWGAACVLSGGTNTVASFLVAGASGNGTGSDGVNYNGGAGCTVNGYNLNSFTLDNYQDLGYGGPNQYNFLNNASGSPTNMANYDVTIGLAPSGQGISVTLTGAVTQQDGLAPWTITTNNATGIGSPFFGFELKYTISDFTNQVAAIKTVTGTQGGLTLKLNSTTTSQNSSEFSKLALASGSGSVFLDNLVTAPATGVTNSVSGGLNATGTSIAVTDNLLLKLHQTAGDGSFISVSSLANVFDVAGQVPEPMTTALVGLGLAGLAMVRRRSSKN